MSQHTNALIHETSPYLLQHAHNPVDWMPWGEAALSKARAENKLIFLSIGYAACHWCHVMEHESFEDEQVAELLNANFISIKVDREERPDLDEIYMMATMIYNQGQGGWPMSVWLAPDLRPVFAGTYFPPENAYGRPGFKTILRALNERWRADPASLTADSDKVVEIVRQNQVASGGGGAVTPESVRAAADQVYRAFDQSLGGIPSGPNKFPPAQAMELLLRMWRHGDAPHFLRIVELTLEKMGSGGIYDHLGGGIARYSTDRKWLVPHFEKMLYDQALVAAIYADGYQATEREDLKQLCENRARGICDYVLRDLTGPEGGFYSSEDADSEGKEGQFYIWTREEIFAVLGERNAKLFCQAYDVSSQGNWNHPGDAHVPAGPKNVLQLVRPAAVIAKLEGLGAADVEASLAASRQRLFEVREKRTRPGLDDKVLSGWNGLMLTALARVGAVFNERRYLEAARRAADFLTEQMVVDGRLCATYGKGSARLTAYATDYAFVIAGLIELYEAAGDFTLIERAEALMETAITHYWDAEEGGFFFTADDAEALLVRSKNVQDGATPSANSTMLGALTRLSVLLDRGDYRDKARTLIDVFGAEATQRPFQSERLLAYADQAMRSLVEVVVVGDPSAPETAALWSAAYRTYRPDKLAVRLDPQREAPAGPLFAGRTLVEGRPGAYVCRDFVCQRPVTEPAELARDLG
ncbi:MAG: thioredoxin domain-containing protein [Acidobacteria bacterium]|nr:thioredoxin domain-containing protein [Acidobacteriota bacterium]